MLVFLASDRARLGELRQTVRDFLAWKSIEADKETLNLDAFQARQAETKRAQFDEAVSQRLGEAFIWVLIPSQASDDPSVVWDETRVSGPDPLAVRVANKLRTEEALISEYSGARLRMDLDRVPLWRDQHVGLSQLWTDYSQYLYLPRLRDSRVLVEAIRSGVALLTWNPDTFAYASAFDEETGRYSGLVAGQLASVVLDRVSVVVKPEVAARQLEGNQEADSSGRGEHPAEPGSGLHAGTRSGEGTDEGAQPALPQRFYGRVTVEPVRMLRDLSEVADAVVSQLTQTGARVTISLEIEASAERGFAEGVQLTVSENARTLRFDVEEFD
jgi:hypothetical protein